MESLSVIIPAFRAEKYLAEAVASVRMQELPEQTEIIVIDDGSDDGTSELAEKLDVILFKKEHGGAASARNAGLRIASGSLIFFLDADDVLCPGALEELYRILLRDAATVAVFAMAEDFISNDLTDNQRAELRPRDGKYGGVLPGCSLIRRSVFDTVGFFDETMKSGETVAWQMKLRESGLKIVSTDRVTLERRLHLSNTGRLHQKQEMSDYAALLRKKLQKR